MRFSLLLGLVGSSASALVLACSSSADTPTPATGGSAGQAAAQAGNATAGSGSTPSGAGMGGTASGGSATGGTAAGGAANAGSASGGSATGGTAAGGSATGGAGANGYCSTRAGLVFCEDFEKFPAGAVQPAAPWSTNINGDGTVEVDTTVAHSGKSALKVHGSGFATFLVLNAGSLAPSASALYVRAYLRLPQAMTGGHNTFIIADRAAMPGTGNAFRLGEMNAMLMYTVSGDTHGALANEKFYTDHMAGAAFTAAQWGCLELTLDQGKMEISVALDGQNIPDLHHTDFPLDAYDALRFGFEKYAGPVDDVWYDDIALGTAPLGCQ